MWSRILQTSHIAHLLPGYGRRLGVDEIPICTFAFLYCQRLLPCTERFKITGKNKQPFEETVLLYCSSFSVGVKEFLTEMSK